MKLMFVANDPGGANVLVPLIQYFMNDNETIVLAANSAVSIFERNHILSKSICGFFSSIEKDKIRDMMSSIVPDIVITDTGASDYLERYIWDVSKSMSIKCVAILDSWCFYGLRFSDLLFEDGDKYIPHKSVKYLPDRVFAMDETSKNCLIKDGIPEDIIRIVGQPYLQMIKDRMNDASYTDTENHIKTICEETDKKIILYISDNLSDSFLPNAIDYWGYDEKTIFKSVYSAIASSCLEPDKYLIVIRPHPKEREDNWDDIIKELEGGKVKILVDNTINEEVIISASDLVIGMWSMLLTVSALAQKKIISVQIGAKRKADFVLSDLDLLAPIFDYEELVEAMKCYFDDNESIKGVEWDVGNDSINKCIEYINDMINEG